MATSAGSPRPKLRDRLRDRRQRRHDAYDAFLSYAREDQIFAEQLQRALERFAKPWYRARSLKVYRDITSLSPQGGLWATLQQGLEKSAWFILLASPQAAHSDWIDREVSWWLENRSLDQMLIVLTEGETAWDDRTADFDWTRSAWAPPSLRGRFPDEPALLKAPPTVESGDQPDLEDLAATVYSAIEQIPKDEALSNANREHRRTIRLARGGVTTLAILLVLAVAGALTALSQRNIARSQARLALSRQLAAVSTTLLPTNLRASLLLAAEAVRRNVNPQTRSALLSAALASPLLVRYFELGADVTALTGAANGRTIVAGLADGRVMRWDLHGTPELVARLPHPVSGVAVSRDGATIAATDGTDLSQDGAAVLVRPGHRPVRLAMPAGQSVRSVGVSPSGATVLVAGQPAASGGPATIAVVNGRTGATQASHDATGQTFGLEFVVPSDRQVVAFDPAYGSWIRRQLPSWRIAGRGGVGLGAHQAAGLPAADGEFMTATNGAPEIPVWRMRGAPSNDRPTLTANAPISTPSYLALSPDGSRLAVADTGTIYIAPTLAPGHQHPEPLALTGNGSVDLLSFFGSDSRLLSAAETEVAAWNLDQYDRIATAHQVPIDAACSGCGGAKIAVSPDGTRAAVVSGIADTAALVDLRSGVVTRVGGSVFAFQFTSPLWDGSSPVFPIVPPAGGATPTGGPSLPPDVRAWRVGEGNATVLTTAYVAPGKAIAVDSRGNIFIQNAASGELIREMTPFPDLQLGDVSITDASINDATDRVAVLLDQTITIVDWSSGHIVARVRDPSATHIASGGRRLFVQKSDGTLEVRSLLDGHMERSLTGDPSYTWSPVPNPQGTIVARQRANHDITLVDADTGATLATVPANADAPGMKVGVAFSPDGTRLITVTDSSTGRTATLLDRDLSMNALIRSACNTAGADLTAAQWISLIGTSSPSRPACA
jgi:WD40 repeat protein